LVGPRVEDMNIYKSQSTSEQQDKPAASTTFMKVTMLCMITSSGEFFVKGAYFFCHLILRPSHFHLPPREVYRLS